MSNVWFSVVLGAVALLGLPGTSSAQHMRGGMHGNVQGNMHGGGFHHHGFHHSFDRRFFDPRFGGFDRGFDRRFFDPHFSPSFFDPRFSPSFFDPRFNSPFFGPRFGVLVPFLVVAQAPVQPAPGPRDKELQTIRLLSLYRAYQAYEVSKGKPPATINDLALDPAIVKELEQRFNLDELGLPLIEAKKEDLARMVMAYEKLAPKDGGLVLFYDGSVKTLTAKGINKPPAQESRLAQFRGRWSTSREMREGEKVRRSQLVLEFRGGELTFYTEEGGKKGNQFTLKVIRVEKGKYVPCLVLGHGESKYVVSYDFQSERMILVGRLLNRPFEGLSLSGEYMRVDEPK